MGRNLFGFFCSILLLVVARAFVLEELDGLHWGLRLNRRALELWGRLHLLHGGLSGRLGRVLVLFFDKVCIVFIKLCFLVR